MNQEAVIIYHKETDEIVFMQISIIHGIVLNDFDKININISIVYSDIMSVDAIYQLHLIVQAIIYDYKTWELNEMVNFL